MMLRRIRIIILCAAAAVSAACSKQSLENAWSTQEDRIDSFIQQVPLAGRDLTNGVIRAAGVLLGGEFSPARSGVGVQQGFTFEHSVHRTIQGGVALGFPGDGIHLFHGDGELLQHIGKADGHYAIRHGGSTQGCGSKGHEGVG